MLKRSRVTPHLMGLAIWLAVVAHAEEPIHLSAPPRKDAAYRVPDVAADAECFAIEAMIDPVVASGGDFQTVGSLVIDPRQTPLTAVGRLGAALTVDLREGADRSMHALWHRGTNLTIDDPDPLPPGWVDTGEYQHAETRLIRDGIGHRVRLVVWADGNGSRVRLFIDAMDRPCEEHRLEERITAGSVWLFAARGGQPGDPTRTSLFSNVRFSELTASEATRLPSNWDTLLAHLDREHPAMRLVFEAADAGRMQEAQALFVQHMRTRTEPHGPTWEHVTDRVLHPDYRTIADAGLTGQYGTVGFFANIQPNWTDTNGATHQWVRQEEPLRLNWSRDNGHLNRHFHWVSYAKSYDETGDARYAERFSDEVLDWVNREPFFWDRTPTIGGLNIMDGTVFRRGYMNTSNIGRRLELTWWPAYEVFRQSPHFRDEAHVAMLVGMIRQADLITNPTSFAVHDDGAAHTTMGLLQSALLLPELTDSARWEALALSRWDQMLDRQFHPDGSHVSLSTGYNWATILTLENFLRLYEQIGREPPRRYFDLLEKALTHPLALSTPSQTQIPQNDGGWSMVDDHYRRTLHWFPHREDFRWMATKGAEGQPPKERSRSFPNAGHYLMRTGWGAGEKYLFFGAGPWGASHGKQDALNIFTQFGSTALIRDAGRRGYAGVGNTIHAGRSLAYNTLSPDWAQENSIPHWKQEMHRGFAPQPRRWVSNDRFDYGEGVFQYGWHNSEEHIRGTWLRQVVFVKGADAKAEGYYLVIDTVTPADDTERTWRHPWQLNPDDIQVRESDHSVVARNAETAMQILPVGSPTDQTVSIVRGQTMPELLGWRIYGDTAKPWPVPTYEWTAGERFSRAWLIQMQATESDWPVTSVETLPSPDRNELRFRVHRVGGGTDEVLRRDPHATAADLAGELVVGDVGIVSRDASGRVTAQLDLTGGEDSVVNLLD